MGFSNYCFWATPFNIVWQAIIINTKLENDYDIPFPLWLMGWISTPTILFKTMQMMIET